MDQVPSHPLGRDFVNAFHPGESRQAKKMINRSLIFEYRWKLLTLLLALALLATGLVRWWQGPEVAIEKVQELFKKAGQYSGLGDFRPSKRGPFGRFSVSQLIELEQQVGEQQAA